LPRHLSPPGWSFERLGRSPGAAVHWRITSAKPLLCQLLDTCCFLHLLFSFRRLHCVPTCLSCPPPPSPPAGLPFRMALENQLPAHVHSLVQVHGCLIQLIFGVAEGFPPSRNTCACAYACGTAASLPDVNAEFFLGEGLSEPLKAWRNHLLEMVSCSWVPMSSSLEHFERMGCAPALFAVVQSCRAAQQLCCAPLSGAVSSFIPLVLQGCRGCLKTPNICASVVLLPLVPDVRMLLGRWQVRLV